MMTMMTMTPLDENHLPVMTSTCNPVRQDIKVQDKKVYSFSRRQVPNMYCFFWKIFQSPGIFHDPSSTVFKPFKTGECLIKAFSK